MEVCAYCYLGALKYLSARIHRSRPLSTAKQGQAETVDPKAEYEKRLSQRRESVSEREKLMDHLGKLRVFVFLAGLILGGIVYALESVSAWWLIIPLVAFFGLMARYARIRRACRRYQRAVRFYEDGLARLDSQWLGKGHTGERFLDETNLYTQDLDIFGSGSVFERVSSARTRLGEERLAEWLSAPASAKEIAARQEAIRELQPKIDLREDLAVFGGEIPPVGFGSLLEWGQQPVRLSSPMLRVLVLVVGLLNVITLVAWLVFSLSSIPFVISLVLSIILGFRLGNRVPEIIKPVESMGRNLFLVAGLISRMERETFTSPLLSKVRSALEVEGTQPSWQFARLAILVDWLNALKNQFFLPLALLLLWRPQMAFAIESWRKHSGPVFPSWLDAIATLEALSSLAGYAYENPDDVFPEILDGPAQLSGEAMGHPLLDKDKCVRNDISIGGSVRLLMISGSNMSGKSTMLRTVGTNTVLALAGAPVHARKMQLTPLAIGATLRVQDSLLEGKSRFFAEITRIRHILDSTNGELPVLFLLDELFHGTNSHDRGIGAQALVHKLLDAGAIGMLTTHDLTLTAITEKLGERAVNVHFADQFVDGEMQFDYTMRPGIVPHSNALALMRAVGLEV